MWDFWRFLSSGTKLKPVWKEFVYCQIFLIGIIIVAIYFIINIQYSEKLNFQARTLQKQIEDNVKLAEQNRTLFEEKVDLITFIHTNLPKTAIEVGGVGSAHFEDITVEGDRPGIKTGHVGDLKIKNYDQKKTHE